MEPHLDKIQRTNRLYLIFRERRRRQPNYKQLAIKCFGTCTFPDWTTVLPILGALVVSAVLIFMSWGALFCPIVIVFFIVWPWVQQRRARRRITTTTLPLWIDEIFSTEGINIPIATDLWLAGTRGPDLIQAIYADVRDRTWRFWFAGALSMNLFFLTAFYAQMKLSWLERGLFAVPLLFTLWQGTRMVQAVGIWRTLGRAITMRFAHWRGEITLLRQIRRGISDAAAAVSYIILMVMLGAYGTIFLNYMFPAETDYKDWWSLRTETIFSLLIITAIGFFLRFLASAATEGVAYALDSYTKEAHVRYVDLMTTRVLEETSEPSRMPPVYSTSVSP
ncbi:hypothetical protein IT570_14270 [Candidatus Sumerlaeota bacterium]|nr:hypothetical protein [Candidatus Sumerlaeota bacterium]